MNLKQLEKLMVEHLKESGNIKTDIRWIRNGLLGLYGVWGAVIVAIVGAFIGKAH